MLGALINSSTLVHITWVGWPSRKMPGPVLGPSLLLCHVMWINSQCCPAMSMPLHPGTTWFILPGNMTRRTSRHAFVADFWSECYIRQMKYTRWPNKNGTFLKVCLEFCQSQIFFALPYWNHTTLKIMIHLLFTIDKLRRLYMFSDVLDFIETVRSIYQNVQYFIRSKNCVLNVCIFNKNM